MTDAKTLQAFNPAAEAFVGRVSPPGGRYCQNDGK